MIFNSVELQDNPLLAEGLRQLTVDARTNKPVFRVSGPCRLQLRDRFSSALRPTDTMGGEDFTLTDVVTRKNDSLDHLEVFGLMVPRDIGLARTTLGTTISMQELIDKFDGFEDWVHKQIRPKVKPEIQHFAPPITERGTTWGTW